MFVYNNHPEMRKPPYSVKWTDPVEILAHFWCLAISSDVIYAHDIIYPVANYGRPKSMYT